MTEREACSVFIISIVKGVEKDWPDIAVKLIPIIGIDLQKDEKAQFDFAIALIAVQMQALPNLLPLQQAARLKTYILEGISFESEYWTTLYRELIKEYDSVWQVALSKQQLPHESIGSLLYDQFNCEQKITFEAKKFKSPFIVSVLGMMTIAGGWWKEFLSKNEVIQV